MTHPSFQRFAHDASTSRSGHRGTLAAALPLLGAAFLMAFTPGPVFAAGGLLGSYYRYDGGYLEDTSFSAPGYSHVFDRIDEDITFGLSVEQYVENNFNGLGFDWEPLGPGAGAFGVRWTGTITIPEHRRVFLGTHADDGSFVYINDSLFVDNGGQHYPTYAWSSTRLGPGTYRITTYLFTNDRTPPTDKSGIDLWWSTQPFVVNAGGWVPSDWLTPPAIADASRGGTPARPAATHAAARITAAMAFQAGDGVELAYQVPAGGVDISIYDARGRRLRELLPASSSAGEGTIRWDGRDGTGQVVPPGVYFAVVAGSGVTASRKIVAVR